MTFSIPYYVWLIIAVLFIIVEIFAAGFFYACFAVGALAAWASSLITANPIWQIIIFCAVSVGLIPVSRIFARKVTDESVPQAGADALVGLNGIVTEAIRPADDAGKMRADGQASKFFIPYEASALFSGLGAIADVLKPEVKSRLQEKTDTKGDLHETG
jgi:membrane protein implicated in regulation of membrane protease activity